MRHWPDLLRVSGSLVTGQVNAYDVLRMLGRDGHPTPLALLRRAGAAVC